MPATIGSPAPTLGHGPSPIAGIVIGVGISLLLWAMILALVWAVR